MTNASHILRLLDFMPVDYNIIKRVITSFNNLHYDKETGILHSIPSARVHELRGPTKLIGFTENESIALVTLSASIAASFSVLDILLSDYLDIKENRKKGQKTYKQFYDYLMYIINDESKKQKLQRKV